MSRNARDAAMDTASVIAVLRKRRSLLMKAYVLHVGLFASTCACAATDTVHIAVATSFWLTLITIPPVLVYTALVDRSCRAVDPTARTAGIMKIIVFTLLLTPYESSLVLPAQNLWIARGILRAWDTTAAARSDGRASAAPVLESRRPGGTDARHTQSPHR